MGLQANSMRRRRTPRPETAMDGQLPAPLGGLDTQSPATSMPPTNAIAVSNLIPAELGLRARLGNSEWCTGLDGPALTVVPFNGSAFSGTNDRLFVTTNTGIWDVTASSQTPTRVLTFASDSGKAGIGQSCVMVSSAGHFLAYCDELNGYHLYTESTGTWQKVVFATQTPWAGATVYAVGQLATNDSGKVYIVTAVTGDATSAGSGGPTGSGTGITDNNVTWDFQFSVSGVDPSLLVGVVSWKNRLMFTEVGSARSWYLGLVSIAGAATVFNFGGQFRAGGSLVGLWNWTANAAVGIDDLLVAISTGGDIVIYVGTDITDASKFSVKGVWSVGALVSGRNVATNFGGDILVASLVGVVPLSRVITGDAANDRSQYDTANVQNLFNVYTGLYGSNFGWQMVLDPKDNALLVLVPIVEGSPGTQLAMSLATHGWFPYSGLPMNCAAPWNGTLYFGTTDGRVCKHDGYVDGVTLSNPNASTPVQWSLISAFQSLGSSKKKQVGMLRVRVSSQSGNPPYAAEVRYDFDTTPMAAVAGTVDPGTSAWDSATWDVSEWGGDYFETQTVFGAVGIGTYVAVAVAGISNGRTIFLGADVSFTVGGFL